MPGSCRRPTAAAVATLLALAGCGTAADVDLEPAPSSTAAPSTSDDPTTTPGPTDPDNMTPDPTTPGPTTPGPTTPDPTTPGPGSRPLPSPRSADPSISDREVPDDLLPSAPPLRPDDEEAVGTADALDGGEPSPGPAAGRPGQASAPGPRSPRPAPTGSPVATTESPEGYDVAAGGEPDPHDRGGPTTRFTVEVEPATGLDPAAVLEVVENALFDRRSWAAWHRLVRVDDPEEADVRVLVATAPTVDARCAEVGLVTNGHFSCWNGRFTALTLSRWVGGDEEFPDLATYRTYLVNHEFGHALGHGHVGCPEPGRPAPVMMQQSRTAEPCEPNPWPFLDG